MPEEYKNLSGKEENIDQNIKNITKQVIGNKPRVPKKDQSPKR